MSVTYKALNKTKGGIRECNRCRQKKPLSCFYRLKRRGGNEYTSFCNDCEKIRNRGMRLYFRKELIAHYSNGTNKCALCPENRLDVLDLDHINGGGIKERKAFKTPMAYYKHLRDSGFPLGLRVLCRNCNWMEWIRRKNEGLKIGVALC